MEQLRKARIRTNSSRHGILRLRPRSAQDTGRVGGTGGGLGGNGSGGGTGLGGVGVGGDGFCGMEFS